MCEITTAHLHSPQSDRPASRWVSPMGPHCSGGEEASIEGLGWTLRGSCFWSWCWCWRGLYGWSDSSLCILGRCCGCFHLNGCILWGTQNRGGVWERWNWPRHATERRAAFPGGARGSVSVFLPAERVDQVGAVSGGKVGQRQRWQPHVLPRGDQLSKSLLVGKGVAWPPRTATSAQTALWHTAYPTPGTSHATTHRLSLLLPHQLSVAHLEKKQRRGRGTLWLDSVTCC